MPNTGQQKHNEVLTQQEHGKVLTQQEHGGVLAQQKHSEVLTQLPFTQGLLLHCPSCSVGDRFQLLHYTRVPLKPE